MKKQIRIDNHAIIIITILIVALTASVFFYPQSYIRTWDSVKYLWDSIKILFAFGVPNDQLTIALPPNGNLANINGATLPTDFTQLIYWFKTLSIALFNKDLLLSYLYDCLIFLIGVLRYAVFLPIIYLLFKLSGRLILVEHGEDVKGDSKALTRYKRFEKRFILPIKTWIKDLIDYWRHHHVFTLALIIIIAITYRLGAATIDVVGFYLSLVKTYNLGTFFSLILSILVDIFVLLYSYDKVVIVIVAIILALKLRKKSARNYLHRQQNYNEQVAADLPTNTMVSGPVASGKTMMTTSLALDIEMQYRNKAWDIIKKYYMMFPEFDWSSFEGLIRARLTTKDEKRKVVNRAQIEKLVTDLYDKFIVRYDKNRRRKTKKRILAFGCDMTDCPLIYFNGIEWIALIDAMVAYGQAYFLYWANKPLSFSNYSIRFDFKRHGYFPIYDHNYIDRDKRDEWTTWNDYYAAIMNMDYHRITKHKTFTPDEYNMFDGGVETITEIDKERLNTPEQAGQEKKSDEANQKNDGWNKDFKLTRHKHTIDNQTFFTAIVDTQRVASVNLDFVETCEAHIRIKSTSENKMALPLFELDYIVCNPIINWYQDYIYKFRSLRKDNTLYNYLFQKVAVFFNNHMQRLLSEFSYKELEFRKEIGKTADEAGERFRQPYYLISQKILADRYRTDCYAGYFSAQKLNLKKGFLDAPAFASTLASPAELEMLRSYFLDLLKAEMMIDAKNEDVQNKNVKTQYKD